MAGRNKIVYEMNDSSFDIWMYEIVMLVHSAKAFAILVGDAAVTEWLQTVSLILMVFD